MHSRLHALVMPFVFFVVGISYLVQIAGARTSVVLVPYVLLGFMAVLLVIVVAQELRTPSPPPSFTFTEIRGPLILLGLFVAYYFSFLVVGFHVSNFLLVFSVARLMRLPLRNALIIAVSAAVVLYCITTLLKFNIPESLLLPEF